eukprot:1333094-Amorphochlora_amoeboformis.AAC.1
MGVGLPSSTENWVTEYSELLHSQSRVSSIGFSQSTSRARVPREPGTQYCVLTRLISTYYTSNSRARYSIQEYNGVI